MKLDLKEKRRWAPVVDRMVELVEAERSLSFVVALERACGECGVTLPEPASRLEMDLFDMAIFVLLVLAARRERTRTP